MGMMSGRQLILKRYKLGDPLGQGGMGAVYQGLDTLTGQSVAIKLLNPEVVAAYPEVVERFAREAEALRALDHPNIVKVLATAQEGDKHYLVLECVAGGSLRDLLDREGQLGVARALEISLDLADALTRAHRLKIIHRDIKPANVLLAQDGTPRLTDFGMAHVADSPRLTQAGMVMGTMHYLSPEACRGEEADARTDIWAFGVLLFEMLVGRPPFEADNPLTLATAITTQPVPDLGGLRPNAPIALLDLVYRMLEKDRERRIPSVRLVGAELEAIIQGKDSPRPPPEISRFATPTPHPTGVPAHNLPLQTIPFVGRETELAELARLLADPSVRLVTILGPGGMGKTRLALEAAQAQLPNFPRGVYLVPLAPLSSAENILSAVAEALGFRFLRPDSEQVCGGDEPKRQLLEYLRQKQMLLVMDNFEHLLPPSQSTPLRSGTQERPPPQGGTTGGVQLVSEILGAAPGVKVLSTSREKLNLREETRFRIEGMDVPQATHPTTPETPADALDYSAIRLFMQGARRARPGFELGGDDLKHVARICRLVGGTPLGILLAAAWVEIFSPQEIADEISRNLDFLETELRDVPDRHRSLRAVFESTWNQLSEAERKMFIKLSVFRGGFTREAAQAVARASLRELVTLVNKSLLRRDPSSGRYEIHELLREYAAERLGAAGQADATRDAHSAYYVEFVTQRRWDLRGRRQIAALDEIEADFENVRQAWRWAVQKKRYTAIGQSSDSLYAFCDMRSCAHEGEDLFRMARDGLAPQPGEEPHPAWGRVLLPWYDLRWYKGRPESLADITAQAESSLAGARKCSDQSGMAHGLALLGAINESSGAGAEAIPLYEQSLDHHPELDDFFWIAIRIGLCYRAAGQHDKAHQYFQQSLDRGLETGDKVRIAWSHTNLGDTVVSAGDYADALHPADAMHLTVAERHWREANTLFREIGTTVGIVRTNADLSSIAFFRGDLEKAKALAEEALEIATDINSTFGRRDASGKLGWVAVVEGEYSKGREYFEEALSTALISREANLGLCFAACGLGDFQAARRHIRAALESASIFHFPALEILLLPAAAIILAYERDKKHAVELLAVAFHHPTSPTELLEKWPVLTRLLAKLETELGPQPFAAAWQRGQVLAFETVLAALADRFQARGRPTSPPPPPACLPSGQTNA